MPTLASRVALKKLSLRFVRNCGAFALTRVMSAGLARVLMYHNFCRPGDTDTDAVSATAIRNQLAYLRRHFHVAPLVRVVEQLNSGRRFEKPTAALTIDDGRRNCYEILFPLLVEFAIPATFFVVSSFISGEDWLWPDKVLWLSDQPSHPDELVHGRIESLFKVLNQMRPEVRNARIAAIAENMSVSVPQEAPQRYAPCSWAQLREMADSGLVEIGSHTVTHPILASITDEESWRELTISRSQIEQGVGRQTRSFCFPNGKPGDFRASQLKQIMDAGYQCAVGADSGLVSNKANPYELPRIGVSGHSDELTFAKALDGTEYYQGKLQSILGLDRAR